MFPIQAGLDFRTSSFDGMQNCSNYPATSSVLLAQEPGFWYRKAIAGYNGPTHGFVQLRMPPVSQSNLTVPYSVVPLESHRNEHALASSVSLVSQEKNLSSAEAANIYRI